MKTYNKEEIRSISKEALEKTGKCEVAIFKDGTITRASGSWEARKPVWLVIPVGYSYTERELFEALYGAYSSAIAIGDW